MIAIRLYLDTSVWSGLFAERQPDHRQWGASLLEYAEREGLELFASDTVLAEFAGAPPGLQKRLLDALERSGATVIGADPEIVQFATACIERGTIPARYEADAMHIAYSVVAGLDAIVSWNMEHIVKLKTKRDVKILCLEFGHRFVEIVTPPEVIEIAQV